MDETLGTIAADEGASWILSPERQEAGVHPGGSALPEEIRKLLNALKDTRTSVTKRVKIGNATYTCRSFLLRPVDGADGQAYMAVYVTKDSSVTDAIDLLAADYNLTDREQEALKAIATGLTSKEIAARMHISPNTVKSFIRIIMLKMSIDSRAAMMSKILQYTQRQVHSTDEEA